MLDFIKKGMRLNNIEMGMNSDEIYNILGKPDDVVDDGHGGYVYYGSYCFGYDSLKKVNEISVEFHNLSKNIIFKDLVIQRFGVELSDSFKLSNRTKINNFIRLLYFLDLKWKIIHNNDINYLTLKIIGGPYAVFNLFDGNINKISIVNGYQNSDDDTPSSSKSSN